MRQQQTTAPQLPIYVINLQRATERRDYIQQHFADLGLEYEFFDAISSTQSHPWFARFAPEKARRYRRCGISRSEMACFISHAMLWLRCLELQAPILVCEDDVVIDSKLLAIWPDLTALVERYGFIKLSALVPRGRGHYRVLEQVGSYKLVEWQRDQSSAIAYLIAPDAARVLLEQAHHICFPVDNYMSLVWFHGVRHISLFPFPCYQVGLPTQISHNKASEVVEDASAGNPEQAIQLGRPCTRWQRYFYKIRRDVVKLYAKLSRRPARWFRW